VSGRRATPQRSEMFGTSSTRFLSVNREGLFDQARQESEGTVIVPRSGPNYVLKAPLRLGARWSSTWQSAQASGPFILPTTKSITGTNQTITVPAGTFRGCVLVTIAGSAPLPGTDALLEVSGREWYAPDVGYVKGIFREKVDGAPQQTAEMVFELQSYSQ